MITVALVIVIAGVSVAVAVFGHQTIKVLETYGAVVFAALLLALFVILAPQFHWTQGPTASGGDYPGAFVLGFMTCFALVASWYPFASDYSRYLPASSRIRSVTLWPAVGVTAPMLLLGLFGLLLPTIDVQLAADQGVLAVISTHAPVWVAVPFFLFVVVGMIWANYLDVYTAGLVALAMGFRLRRWQAAVGMRPARHRARDLCGADQRFSRRLRGLPDPHVSLGARMGCGGIAHLFLFEGKPGPSLALAAWGTGTVLSLAFVNYGNLFSNLGAGTTFSTPGSSAPCTALT